MYPRLPFMRSSMRSLCISVFAGTACGNDAGMHTTGYGMCRDLLHHGKINEFQQYKSKRVL